MQCAVPFDLYTTHHITWPLHDCYIMSHDYHMLTLPEWVSRDGFAAEMAGDSCLPLRLERRITPLPLTIKYSPKRVKESYKYIFDGRAGVKNTLLVVCSWSMTAVLAHMQKWKWLIMGENHASFTSAYYILRTIASTECRYTYTATYTAETKVTSSALAIVLCKIVTMW